MLKKPLEYKTLKIMMNNAKLFFSLFTFLIIPPVLSQVKVEMLDAYLINLSENGKFNGNILLADKGNIIYQKSFGLANETTGEQLTLNHIFETASVSKQFTAMAILILNERKKMSLDDELSKYIPELNNYPTITVKNLLHHTSGLPDYLRLDSLFDKSKINDNKDLIAIFAKHSPKLQFTPNTKHLYSNTNYVFLATIIEKVSGKSFSEFLKTEIFKPLEMNNSFVYRRRYKPEKIKNYAYGYVYSDSLKRNIIPDSLPEYNKVIYLDGIQGDGIVNSTLQDLLKWDRALYTNKLISKKSIDEMFMPTPLSDSAYYQYGYGWRIHKNSEFGKVVSHSGGWPGYNAYIERHLDNDKTIIILTNSNKSVHSYSILQRALYNLPLPNEIKVDSELLNQYTGEYALNPNAIFKISLSDGQLMAQQPDGEPLSIYPETQSTFFFEEFQNVRIEFIKNDNGDVTKFIITDGENITDVIKKNKI